MFRLCDQQIKKLFLLTFICLSSLQCGKNKDEADSAGDSDSESNNTDDTSTPKDTDTIPMVAPPALLVDDFEDGDHLSVLGGRWYYYTDVDHDGASTLAFDKDTEGNIVMTEEGYNSKFSFRTDYSLDQGDYIHPPYAGWGVILGEEETPYVGQDDEKKPFDAGSYGGVSYWYKGSAHIAKIDTTDVTDYDYHTFPVEAADDWTLVEIPFHHFSQTGWGDPKILNPQNIIHLSWQVEGETGDTGFVQLDMVGLLDASANEREADLVIRDAEIPDKVVLDSLEISNPMQTLAMNHLNKGYNIADWLEKGIFESYLYDETFVNYVAAAGFRSIRLPIDFDLYIENRADYFAGNAEFAIDPLLFEILDNFDTWTRNAGLSLSIDFHQYDESFDFNDAFYIDTVVKLWTAVAAHFADNTREDLFFELINEPEQSGGVSSVDAEAHRAIAKQLIEGIRSVDTTHAILFGAVAWNSLYQLIEQAPFNDDKMIYVFHFYEPFIFTHQGTSWNNMAGVTAIPYPYSPERWSEYSSDFGFVPTQELWQFQALNDYYAKGSYNWMNNQIALVKQWAVDNNVPVICDEFGVYDRTAPHEDRIAYYADLIHIFEELEIPWQHWFMTIDSDTGEMDANLQIAFGLK